MVNHTIKKLPKNTLEINVNISWDEVKKGYQTAFSTLQKELKVEGFRKGNVPKTIAEKKINKESVYQELLKSLLPKIYEDIVKNESLKPVINPKIELVRAKENEDWKLLIKIAEKPVVVLGDYKKIVKEIKLKSKKDEIWVPGKGQTKPEEKKDSQNYKILNEILSGLLEKVSCEISELIVEEELNRRLTKLVDDVQKIGLTTESYLKSKNITIDQLKAQYTKEIEDTYKMEFILNEIADIEKISVEKDELEKLVANIKDENERKLALQNSYFYAMILRKQKTLDFLNSL